MPVTFRSYGASPGATSTTCVITKPAGLTVADLMIAQIGVGYGASAVTITPPSGWASFQATNYGNVLKSELFWKIAVAGDVAATTFTFTLSASRDNKGTITAWYGHNSTTPINASAGQANAASTTVTAPTITPSVANCMLLMICTVAGVNTQSNYAIAVSNPASWTERYDLIYSGDYDTAIALGSALRPETTATGLGTATTSSSVINIGQLVAIAGAVSLIQQAVGQGAITPSSILGRKISIIIGAGSITPAGVLSAAFRFFQTVGQGTVSTAGVLGRAIKIGVGLGSVAPSGLLGRATKILVGSGSITPSGILGRTIKVLVGSGSVTPIGVLSAILIFFQSVGQGAVTSVGTLGRKVAISLGAGIITPVGSLGRKIARAVGSGAITPVGILVRKSLLTVGQGIVIPVGSLGRKIFISVGLGTVVSVGTLVGHIPKYIYLTIKLLTRALTKKLPDRSMIVRIPNRSVTLRMRIK